jgi:hypothetical protein
LACIENFKSGKKLKKEMLIFSHLAVTFSDWLCHKSVTAVAEVPDSVLGRGKKSSIHQCRTICLKK